MDSPTYSLFGNDLGEFSTETPFQLLGLQLPTQPPIHNFAVRATAGGVHSSRAICSAEADLNKKNATLGHSLNVPTPGKSIVPS